MTLAEPTRTSERIALLDVLRGLALVGVLFANVPPHYSGPQLNGPVAFAGADATVAHVVGALFMGKFYVLFSLLFGIGLVLQAERAVHRGEPVTLRYGRRLAGLIVLGVLHGVLLFDGDILLAYGLLGFALLLFVDVSPRTAAAWAVGLVVFGAMLTSGITALEALLPEQTPAVDASDAVAPGWLEALRLRALGMALQVPLLLVLGPQVLGMFVLGVGVARGGWLRRPDLLRLWRGPVLLAGLALGLPGGWFAAGTLIEGRAPLTIAAGLLATGLGGPLVALGITGWVAAWLERFPASRVAAFFGNVGRMSLTCYLGQSLLLEPLLAPAYFGLSQRLSLLAVMPIAALVYVVLAIFAALWLRRYRFGPAEWALRSWTYGRRQPLRSAPSAPVVS